MIDAPAEILGTETLDPSDIKIENQGRQQLVNDEDELVLSIASLGQLQAIGVERLPDGNHVLIYGERRVKSITHIRTHNPQWPGIEAKIYKGPLTETMRCRIRWEENAQRVDLAPGELAKQLLLTRNAKTADRLRKHNPNIEIPPNVKGENPSIRYKNLADLCVANGLSSVGMDETLAELRLDQTIKGKWAYRLVQIYAALPEELTANLDQEGIAVTVRKNFVELHRANPEFAEALFDAVREQPANRPDILKTAITESLENPQIASTPPTAETIKPIIEKAATKPTKKQKKKQTSIDQTEPSNVGGESEDESTFDDFDLDDDAAALDDEHTAAQALISQLTQINDHYSNTKCVTTKAQQDQIFFLLKSIEMSVTP